MKNAEISQKLPNLIVLLGPTASGKTGLSIELAKKFKGEIVSADSRQIYKKMSIGTAKIPGQWDKHPETKETVFIFQDVPHYLIDFVDPGQEFTLAQFQKSAHTAISKIAQRGKLPLLVGGTGLYIHAVVDNLQIPAVPPNKKLRRSLETRDNLELVALLHKLDPKTAQTVDPFNQRRLIRALEVCIWTGRPFSEQQKKKAPLFNTLQLGIAVPREELHNRIATRAHAMMEMGLLGEVRALVRQKYGWRLPSMSGTGYRQFADYFANKISLNQAIELLKRDTRRYARRQMTWFKRDERIQWIKDSAEATDLINKFLEQ